MCVCVCVFVFVQGEREKKKERKEKRWWISNGSINPSIYDFMREFHVHIESSNQDMER